MKYRREIDGLRAMAVVPVILFHGDLSAFRGGFGGVACSGTRSGVPAAWLRVDPLLVHVALIMVCVVVFAALSRLVLRFARERTVPLLPLAGVRPVLGEVLVYHYRHST